MRLIQFFLIIFIFTSCTTKGKKNNSETRQVSLPEKTAIPDTQKIADHKPIEVKSKEKISLYLNGVYEYVYPNNTDNLKENHYLAFKKTKNITEGWYYGTSDEFDKAREGYLPGFFVSKIRNLSTRGDSLFFEITTGYNKCFSKSFPIGIIDSTEIIQTNEKWNDFEADHDLKYAGKLDGLEIEMFVDGELRKYRKRKNRFHIGIDNFDENKCLSEPLIALSENIENLNDSIMFNFLNTFSVICANNIEFSQWSNELLFKVMDKEPALFVKILSNNIELLDTSAIYREMRAPLYDLIDVNSIRQKISILEIENDLKEDLMKKLADK